MKNIIRALRCYTRKYSPGAKVSSKEEYRKKDIGCIGKKFDWNI